MEIDDIAYNLLSSTHSGGSPEKALEQSGSPPLGALPGDIPLRVLSQAAVRPLAL
jgi:hypothetical protein